MQFRQVVVSLNELTNTRGAGANFLG